MGETVSSEREREREREGQRAGGWQSERFGPRIEEGEKKGEGEVEKNRSDI